MGAQLWAPYLLLLVMGMFNLSLGCLASSLTSNQILAAMIASVLVMGIFFLTMIGYAIGSSSPILREITSYVAQLDHMDTFSRGVIDSRPLVFYPTCTALVLLITYHVFQYRRWKVYQLITHTFMRAKSSRHIPRDRITLNAEIQ